MSPLDVKPDATGASLTDAELRATPVPVEQATSVTADQGAAAAAGSPWSIRLSDGAAFYNAPVAGQLPAALDTGALKTKEQSPLAQGLTDTQLRATAVPVSGTVATGALTDAQLRATAVPVSGTVTASGPLTDAQLAARLPLSVEQATSVDVADGGGSLTVDGPVTDTQLRASSLAVKQDNPTATSGTVTANGGAGGTVGPVNTTGMATLTVAISGTYAGVGFTVAASFDGGTTYVTLPTVNASGAVSTVPFPSNNASGIYVVPLGGVPLVKLVSYAYTSGTMSVVLAPSSFPSSSVVSTFGTTTVDSELPAAAALSDALGNPTAPMVGAAQLWYDGTQWLRIRPGAATSAVTNVAASATSVTLIAANTARKQLIINNGSAAAILYVKFGSAAVVANSFTWQLAALSSWAVPTNPIYTGIVTGIWSAATGNGAQITEITT